MEPIESSFRKSVEREFNVFGFAEVDVRIPANQKWSSGRTECIIVEQVLEMRSRQSFLPTTNPKRPTSHLDLVRLMIQSVGGPSHNEIGTWEGALANTCCMQGHYNQLGRNQIPGSQLHVFAELLGMLIGRAKRFFGGTEMIVQGCQIDTAI
ncbi:hypothetical protein EAF00_011069 [Botryotinia globosa]|nr:hypothetical protein EAF00_011069 [Botryotinia globosa]